jgi:hypothetical protein
MMMSLRGSVLLPFAITLLGSCLQAHGQQNTTGNGVPATPVPSAPVPDFQTPAVVIPGVGGQQAAASSDDDKKRDQSNPTASPYASTEDDYVPNQAPVTPRMRHELADSSDLYTIHLRPLFATGIKLPDDVIAIAVGAPTLIWAEHSKDVPRLIFVKPTTNAPVNSNLIVSLKSGATITLHVISSGEKGSDDPVDFMVDYSTDSSLLRGEAEPSGSLFRNHAGESSAAVVPFQTNNPADSGAAHGQSGVVHYGAADPQPSYEQSTSGSGHFDPASAAAAGAIRTAEGKGVFTVPGTLLESMYQEQVSLATPKFMDGVELSRVYPADKKATSDLAVSIGRMVQQGDTMTFSYSVQNRSSRTIEIMPPHLEFSDPKPVKPNKKKPTAVAEQMDVDDYILTATKLAPGQRVDGAIQFERPSFKYKKQLLMLQVASASEVDTALLSPVPFTTQFGSN